MTSQIWLTAKEVMERLHINEPTLADYICRRVIPVKSISECSWKTVNLWGEFRNVSSYNPDHPNWDFDYVLKHLREDDFIVYRVDLEKSLSEHPELKERSESEGNGAEILAPASDRATIVRSVMKSAGNFRIHNKVLELAKKLDEAGIKPQVQTWKRGSSEPVLVPETYSEVAKKPQHQLYNRLFGPRGTLAEYLSNKK
jgi:hypothetical protein